MPVDLIACVGLWARTRGSSWYAHIVSAGTSGVQLFFDQVASELRFLADMSSVTGLFDAQDAHVVPAARLRDTADRCCVRDALALGVAGHVRSKPGEGRDALQSHLVGVVLVAVEHDNDAIEAPRMDAKPALALGEQTLGVLDDPERLGAIGCSLNLHVARRQR